VASGNDRAAQKRRSEILRGRCRRRTSRSCGDITRGGITGSGPKRRKRSRRKPRRSGNPTATTTRFAAPREARPCHGRDEIVAFLAEYRAAWDAYRYEIKDVRAIADDRVLVLGHVSAEGRASGMPVEGDLNHCCWLRHGRFIRVEDHLTLRGALHALGLGGESVEAAGLSE
jgi:SnoaL-like domain